MAIGRRGHSLCAQAHINPEYFGGDYATLEQRLEGLTGRALRNRADEIYIWKVVPKIPYYTDSGERMFVREENNVLRESQANNEHYGIPMLKEGIT